MEIRVINKNNEIVNISRMAIITTMSKWLVGINDRGETTRIEAFKSEEEAKEKLEELGEIVIKGAVLERQDIVIEMGNEDEDS